jgi:hypothetical protein
VAGACPDHRQHPRFFTGRRAIPLRHPDRRFRPGWRNQSVRPCAEVAEGNLRDELSLDSRVWRSASKDGDRCRYAARIRREGVRVLSNCWSCQQSFQDRKQRLSVHRHFSVPQPAAALASVLAGISILRLELSMKVEIQRVQPTGCISLPVRRLDFGGLVSRTLDHAPHRSRSPTRQRSRHSPPSASCLIPDPTLDPFETVKETSKTE